ncbi:hypothetical protein [Mycobacterium canetti]|uniref:hypothetical protein n=1 Tax=Mycobacterium canetti TaxID=78331 RepID=UPI001564457D|nr:hypothetical protein [Mycobacterium canetti]
MAPVAGGEQRQLALPVASRSWPTGLDAATTNGGVMTEIGVKECGRFRISSPHSGGDRYVDTSAVVALLIAKPDSAGQLWDGAGRLVGVRVACC